MKRQILNLLTVTLLTLILSCKKTDTDLSQPTTPTVKGEVVTSTIIASKGGSLQTKDDIKLVIPAGALPKDTEVKIGITGNETQTIPNTKLSVIGKPFTVIIPADSLKATAIITIPKTQGYINEQQNAIFAYNGETYMPLFYKEIGDNIEIYLDIIQWSDSFKTTLPNGRVEGAIGELVIYILKYAQTPDSIQLGLKEITLDNKGKFVYSNIQSIETNEKALILIHGWNSDPSTWEAFVPLFKNRNKSGYTHILTFGYNTCLSIKDNGEKLANALKSTIKCKADIVAHSMGGLVSRSAIENFGANPFIDNLITLGTPHLGSPLAALRRGLGILIRTEPGVVPSNLDSYTNYNINTQGFRDLFPNSDFLKQLRYNNPNDTLRVPYFTIAGVYNRSNCSIPPFIPEALTASLIIDKLLGENSDFIVPLKSAKGVTTVYSDLPSVIKIDACIAHTALTSDVQVINTAADYLTKMSTLSNNNCKNNLLAGLVAYYPFEGDTKDKSGNGNDGKKIGDIAFVDGVKNKGANFHGLINANSDFSNVDRVEVMPSNSLTFEEEMTLYFWYKFPKNFYESNEKYCNGNDVGGFVGRGVLSIGGGVYSRLSDNLASYQGDISSIPIGFQLTPFHAISGFLDGIQIDYFGNNNNSTRQLVEVNVDSYSVPEDAFTHIVLVYKNNTIETYVNGEYGFATQTFDRNILKEANVNSIIIGASRNIWLPSTGKLYGFSGYVAENYHCFKYIEPFEGIIDEFRIYNRVLTESEIKQLYDFDKKK